MKQFFLLIMTLFVLVYSSQDGVSYFSRKFTELIKCIEEHDSMNVVRFDNNTMMKKAIAMIITEKVFNKSISDRLLHSESTLLSTLLKDHGYIYLDGTLRQALIEISIKRILKDCADDVNDSSIIGNINESSVNDFNDGRPEHAVNLPSFPNEPIEFSLLLDYILVNWPHRRENMFSTRIRRDLLWNYALDTLELFQFAYTILPPSVFQYRLRLLWGRRANLLFNAQISPLPYINHIYDIDHLAPHMHENLSIYLLRFNEIAGNRNPPASQENLERILNIHAHTTSDQYELDLFDNYQENGMTSADYYFEFHLDQVYRLLFIFLEIQRRTIISNGNDLSYFIVPEELQAIFVNDTAYRNYLINRRNYELNIPEFNTIYRKNLERSNRPREEDLIMMFMLRNRNLLKKKKSIASSTNRTTIIETTTTISSTQHSRKRMGDFGDYENENGEQQPKKQKSSYDKCYENSGASYSKNFINLQQQKLKTHYKYDGYNNSEEFGFPTSEISIFLKTLFFKINKSALLNKNFS